ncbi:MAG: hypothetical protein ACR2PG_12605, partial [Hyphomicrobiaceae bacterium]
MRKITILVVATAIVAIMQIAISIEPSSAQNRRIDCAHGPDIWRVRNVASWDRLNIRSGPSHRRTKVGSIPPDGRGVHCLGPCRGNWCRIS